MQPSSNPSNDHAAPETEADLQDMIELSALAQAFALLEGHDDAAYQFAELRAELKDELIERGAAPEEQG